MFTSCVYEAQILHAKTSPAPVYAYVYSYKGQETPSYAAVFSDLVKRSGFRHPLINTGNDHSTRIQQHGYIVIGIFRLLIQASLTQTNFFTYFAWPAFPPHIRRQTSKCRNG